MFYWTRQLLNTLKKPKQNREMCLPHPLTWHSLLCLPRWTVGTETVELGRVGSIARRRRMRGTISAVSPGEEKEKLGREAWPPAVSGTRRPCSGRSWPLPEEGPSG